MTKMLINEGAEYKIKDEFGQSPLFYCAVKNRKALLLYYINELNMDVNESDYFR